MTITDPAPVDLADEPGGPGGRPDQSGDVEPVGSGTPGPRARRRLAGLAAVVVVLGWVWYAPYSVLGTANVGLGYALVALSLVVLTGWVGQISLAQASFVGVGALATGVLVRSVGLPFPLTLPAAAGIAAAAAALLGVVALRVRGLYLAVATLIFAWMVSEFFFNQTWLAGVGGSATAFSEPIGEQGKLPYFDFTDRTLYYYVSLAVLAAALLGAANLRDSKTGRAWFALKGSEVAAASLGIAVTRYKLIAFAVSGALAGIAGNLVITHQQVAAADSFAPSVSLFFLAVAVVGGLTRPGGAVAAGLLFAGLEELFYRLEALAGLLEVVSSLLLAVVLLFFPQGLAGLPDSAARALRRLRHARAVVSTARLVREVGRELAMFATPRRAARSQRRALDHRDSSTPETSLPSPPVDGDPTGTDATPRGRRSRGVPDVLAAVLARSEPPDEEPAGTPLAAGLVYEAGSATKVELPPRPERTVVLAAEGITVRFGGLTAVEDVSLEVREGEIVGLIGPNGAGKTTLFNAVSGLNSPTEGTVELYGQDVTKLDVHERAARGMGRTFQAIQLFRDLSVVDNLLVATHSRNPSRFPAHLVASATALEGERQARDRVRQVVRLVGLDDVAGRPVGGLPFGVLRLVELARALVTGSPFVMLDEPASGLDNTETNRFADLLLWVRQTLGITLLLIEHDVRMVTSLSDHMYVIDRGRLIAHGTPGEVQRDEAVIEAYLGRSSDDATRSSTDGRPPVVLDASVDADERVLADHGVDVT